MSISILRLFDEKNNPYELELLAGADGLSREVSWIQVMEDKDYASFLLRDELLFTTGLGKDQQERWLYRFITALIEAGSAGVVINIGKYVFREDITPDIISLCDEHRFPLFTMPWKIRLADVTQSFLYSLFLTQQREYELIEACRTLLFTKDGTEKVMRTLLAHGFPRRGQYQVIAIGDENCSETHVTAYKGYLNEQGRKYILFPVKTGCILICPVISEETGRDICRHILTCANDVSLCLGCGMVVFSLDDILYSYTQALQSLVWAKSRHKPAVCFSDLGVYAILFSQKNEMAMLALHDRMLGTLLAYDEEHQRSLYDTFVSYLRHDGGIRAVAAETFAHRNTVLYRMQKIKQLLGCDLQNSDVRFTYMLACHIHMYLDLKKEWSSYYNRV